MIPAFEARGVAVDLAGYHTPPSRPGLLAGYDIAPLGKRRLPGLLGRAAQAVALRRLISASDYDAVIGMGPIANGLVCLARSGSDRSVTVVSERGDPFIEKRRRWNRWFVWIYRRVDLLVVQTEGLARDVRRRWAHVHETIVIANPVPAAAPVRQPSENRDAVIVTVGRLRSQKRQSDLIDAFSRLGGAADGWSLLIVGDGPERAALEQQAARLGVGARTRFLGLHPAPWELLSETSIFAHCSEYEGYPNALLEAAASGCALVSSDCRFGPADMIDHGVSGLLYPVGDVEQLCARLRELIDDPARRAALARASTAWAATRTTDAAVTAWLDAIASRRRA